MRLEQLKNTYLYENLDYSETKSVQLWESAGYKLKEAQLTADQIDSIFTSVERGLTDAGSNRTMLGKGKDAMTAVNKAWEDLKTKIQDSGPIKNVDTAYDSAVAKIEKGLGGPDNAVSKMIMSYRKFAKEHPIAQGFIYSALIAAAGISGAGLGGAAVLALLKMTDKLLQGEKFSSAAYSGAKTGAMAYGASKLGDYLKGKPEGDVDPAAATQAAGAIKGARGLADEAARIFKEKVAAGEINDYNSYQQGMQDALDQALKNAGGQMSFQSQQTAQMILRSKLDAVAAQAAGGQFSGSGPEKVAAVIQGLGGTVDSDRMATAINAANTLRKASRGESVVYTKRTLSEGQIYMIINRVCIQNEIMLEEGYVVEGPMDALKGLAGKAVGAAKTFGKNLTTKITADKLKTAWQKAGSPTDSDEVYKILQAQGVADDVIGKVYTDLKLPAAGTAEPTDNAPEETPAAADATGSDNATTSSAPLKFADVKAMVEKLPTDRKIRLLKYLTKQGSAAPAKPAAKKSAPAAPLRDAGDGRIEPTMA